MSTDPPPYSLPQRGAAGPRFAAFVAFVRRSFVAYARWLDSITWRRFFVLSLLAMIAAGVLSELPPFNIRWGEDRVIVRPAKPVLPPATPALPSAAPTPPAGTSKRPALVIGGKPYEIVVDGKGVRIGPVGGETAENAGAPRVTVDRQGVRIRGGGDGASAADISEAAASAATAAASAAASAASAAAAAASAVGWTGSAAAQRAAYEASVEAQAAADVAAAARSMSQQAAATAAAAASASGNAGGGPHVTVPLPRDADTDAIREAVQEAASSIEEAIRDAAEAAEDAKPRHGTQRAFRLGDHLPGFMFLLIVLSGVTKIMAAGRFKAEAQAVVATEMAESEALKRQVVEARMAAMQAQVEPHFLFNTLASIDHLIETDPPRASRMQKNLIALLRAAMPSMREANAQGGGTRDLGRELAVIRPFLEILKVRMEERLQTEIRVSDGLLSAEFPPMMLQGLVENAIKHGLEPKAEGGSLLVAAEIVHGKLAVSVVDSGIGFATAQKTAATAGTGIGLSNIRERLQLLYGGKAALAVSDNPSGGTSVTITVPYAMRADSRRDSARKEPA